jgi:hypothetical protein
MSCFFGTHTFAACEDTQPFITVFVHGSKLTPSGFSKKYLFRMPGMHHIDDYAPLYNCRQVAELLVQADPTNYTLKHYHYFGWNGKLDFNERKKAAHDLYTQLERLYYNYIQTSGKTPKIRIITHSHGGNVLLNLAHIIPENSPIFIDEAIILACPVQEKTKHFIANPRFKKVYAFYSGNDMFQVLDPQGWYKKGKSKKLFSERTFPKSSNLRQARIKLQGRHPMHIDFFLPKFMANLPAACKKLDELYENTPSQQACRNKQLDIYYKRVPTVIFTSFLP